jgi:hypothetical protein
VEGVTSSSARKPKVAGHRLPRLPSIPTSMST